jgi:hypothetical protein
VKKLFYGRARRTNRRNTVAVVTGVRARTTVHRIKGQRDRNNENSTATDKRARARAVTTATAAVVDDRSSQ